MRLSILDQSPIRQGGTAQQALQETLQLAQHVEALGYHRFWVSEHHNTTSLAGSAPEVLLAAVGAATQRIRIGSGGVMLPHYSAFKVAETFSLLSNLYPGRIDLGVGRAPGSDMRTAQILATDGRPKFERFPTLVEELRLMLTDPSFRPRITPAAPSPPPIWMLGSSHESALLAAHYGLPYNFALFINSQMSSQIFELYRTQFTPSEQLAEPTTMLTVNVICAETEAEARRLAMSRQLLFLRFARGEQEVRVPPVEEAEAYPYNDQELAFLHNKFYRAVVGDPQQVKQGLLQLAQEFGADEIMTVTITYDFQARLRSYELLMDAFQA
ncbi:MAG: LLM class flavin-dependent oxidoreductase [Caldilineaceae bacterium]|nr:LLM class flavin-dependent oxidoreductase [Caldilineaceae bacterium]